MDASEDGAGAVAPVLFRDIPPREAFDQVGFGEDGATLFAETNDVQLFKDRGAHAPIASDRKEEAHDCAGCVTHHRADEVGKGGEFAVRIPSGPLGPPGTPRTAATAGPPGL